MSGLTRDGTENERADKGWVSRTYLARPNSQVLTGTGEISIFPVQLTTSRIGNLTRLVHTLLKVLATHVSSHLLPPISAPINFQKQVVHAQYRFTFLKFTCRCNSLHQLHFMSSQSRRRIPRNHNLQNKIKFNNTDLGICLAICYHQF